MVRTAAVVAALVVVAGIVGAVPVAAFTAVAESGGQATPTNVSNGSMEPGERLAGVVGAEKAEVDGEVAVRAFGQRIAAARSNASKAGVVSEEIETLQAKLDALSEKQDELKRAHENGTLSTGEYRARLAELHAEQRSLQRLVNTTQQVAQGLPAESLREKGVNVTAIQRLKADAQNLTGPQVAAIARSISGKKAGSGLGSKSTGPPAFVENQTRGNGPGNTDRDAGTGPQAGPGNETGSQPESDKGNGPPAARANETSPPADRGEANRTG